MAIQALPHFLLQCYPWQDRAPFYDGQCEAVPCPKESEGLSPASGLRDEGAFADDVRWFVAFLRF